MSSPHSSNPVEDWKIIRVHGSDRDMGRQHAEQCGAVCRVGMPKFYHDLVQRMLNRPPSSWRDRLVQFSTKQVIDSLLVERFLKQVPGPFRERVEGLAESAGLDRREMEIALVLPDLIPWLQSGFRMLQPYRFVPAAPAVSLGCSSFISRGTRMLVGRNLDFPGVGYWDRYPTIQCTAPKNGLRSISFTTAGVPIGGITGVNEAQIFVAIHQHYSRRTRFAGTLPFILGEKILSQAGSAAQALELLESASLANGWAFIVADGKSRQAFVWEGAPGAKGVRHLNEVEQVLAHSNYYQTPACQLTEYATSARMNWDNYWRKTRLEENACSMGHDLTPTAACAALSDHYDAYWGEEKIVNRTVSQAYNLQSVVVDPENMTAWLATGPSPIHLGEYREFDLGAILNGRDGSTERTIPGFRFADRRKDQAKRHFIASFIDAMDGDEAGALDAISVSLQSDFCPEVALTASVLGIKKGELERSRDWLGQAAAWIEGKLRDRKGLRAPPEYFEIRLFQGRVEDLLGNPAEARRHYQALLASNDLEDGNIRRLAKRGSFQRKDIDRLVLAYSTYGPFL